MLSNASIIFTRFSLPDLDDDFTAQDMKNIQRIYKNVLMTTNSREQQKALVKKYLKWVSRQQKRKTNCCVLFLFSTTFQTTSEKIQLLRTWIRRCDLPIISWANSQKILLLLERRLLNNIVRLASLFLIYVSNFTADRILYLDPVLLFFFILSFLLLNWVQFALFPSLL